MITNQAFLSQYRTLTSEATCFSDRIFRIEPVMGGESKLMLVLELPASGLESYQLDYLKQLKHFADSEKSFLTPLEISLEGQQLLAITQLPDTPTLAELGRLSIDEGERLLRRLLVKVASAQQEDLRLGCYQPECIHISGEEIYCNILAAVVNITIRGTEKDTVQVASSIIQSITGVRITPESLDSYWQAEINFENPRLRQLLDDLLCGRVTWAEAALTHLQSNNQSSTDISDCQATDKSETESFKTTSILETPTSLPTQNSEFSQSTSELIDWVHSSSKSPFEHDIIDSSDGEYTRNEFRWALILLFTVIGAVVVAGVINRPVTTSSSGNSDQTASGDLGYQSTCGSSDSPNGSWWPVLGDSQHLSQVRENYCGDAFINTSGELQVASFNSESAARDFASSLSQASGHTFQVGAEKQLSSPSPQVNDGQQCIFQNSAGERSYFNCKYSQYVNSRNDKVISIDWGDGEYSKYVFRDDNQVEIWNKGAMETGSWRNEIIDNFNYAAIYSPSDNSYNYIPQSFL